MGHFQDGWGACFQLATRWGESEATWLQPDHWQDGLMKWKENGNMKPPNGNGRWRQHLLLLPQSALVDTITDHNKPPRPITQPHRDVGSVVELRSSKEIVASLGWLEDLPMLPDRSGVVNHVNRLQLFSFFIFSGFSCQLYYFCWRSLAMLIDAGHNCFHALIYHLRTPASQTGPKSTLRSRNSACWNPSRWDIPSIHPAKYSYIQKKNRISKSPSPWKKTRNLLVSNFLRQSRALRTLTKWKFVIVHSHRSVQ